MNNEINYETALKNSTSFMNCFKRFYFKNNVRLFFFNPLHTTTTTWDIRNRIAQVTTFLLTVRISTKAGVRRCDLQRLRVTSESFICNNVVRRYDATTHILLSSPTNLATCFPSVETQKLRTYLCDGILSVKQIELKTRKSHRSSIIQMKNNSVGSHLHSCMVKLKIIINEN